MCKIASFRVALVALVAVALTLVTGCGGKGTVTGKVTYAGKALPYGSVQFQGSGGVLVGEIQPDGSYTVSGVGTGSAKISVTCQDPKYADYMRAVSAAARDPKGPKPKGRPEDFDKIPSRYSDFEQSGLTYEVKGGTQTHNIDLK